MAAKNVTENADADCDPLRFRIPKVMVMNPMVDRKKIHLGSVIPTSIHSQLQWKNTTRFDLCIEFPPHFLTETAPNATLAPDLSHKKNQFPYCIPS